MRIKKLFPENKESKKGLLDFLDKKGFYIILILCVAVVGATAVFVTTYRLNSPDSDYYAQDYIPEDEELDDLASLEGLMEEKDTDLSVDAASSIAEELTEAKSSPAPEPSPAASAAPKTSTGSSTPSPTAQPQKSAAPAQSSDKASSTNTVFAPIERPNFIMPVAGGEVISVFAQDKLIYSKTLEDWRTHNGVDLSAERGTNVKAVADGIVADIKNDPRFGYTVVIDHQNGFKTVYANLASDDVVSTNQKVKQGEIIGSVGNSALFESAEQPHLHFQVFKDDVLVDPMEYLPKTSAENK